MPIQCTERSRSSGRKVFLGSTTSWRSPAQPFQSASWPVVQTGSRARPRPQACSASRLPLPLTGHHRLEPVLCYIARIYKGSPALDAGLLAAAQAVEHYEISRYGTLIAWAEELGLEDAASLLEETLEEEKATDEALADIEPAGSTRREAKDWCLAHYPGFPSKRSVRSTPPVRSDER
jgi:hypothetical protein